ncbi:MAG: hypothetical protein MUE53_03425 [Chitinophagales bacterium]|nr:hypothetical protein [Chitinophagales bacterium]
MWARKGLRAGGVSGTQWDDSDYGDYSFGFGQDAKAKGKTSFSLGEKTEALEELSYALGFTSISKVKYNFALGDRTTAIGYQSSKIIFNFLRNNIVL